VVEGRHGLLGERDRVVTVFTILCLPALQDDNHVSILKLYIKKMTTTRIFHCCANPNPYDYYWSEYAVHNYPFAFDMWWRIGTRRHINMGRWRKSPICTPHMDWLRKRMRNCPMGNGQWWVLGMGDFMSLFCSLWHWKCSDRLCRGGDLGFTGPELILAGYGVFSTSRKKKEASYLTFLWSWFCPSMRFHDHSC